MIRSKYGAILHVMGRRLRGWLPQVYTTRGRKTSRTSCLQQQTAACRPEAGGGNDCTSIRVLSMGPGKWPMSQPASYYCWMLTRSTIRHSRTKSSKQSERNRKLCLRTM